MSPDLTDLLHRTGPSPRRPVDVRRLVRRGRRRALAAPAAAAVGLVGAAAAAGLLLNAPAEVRLDVAAPAPPSAAPSPAVEAPPGSGACPTTRPVGDGSGQALPADFVADVLVVCGNEYREFPGDGGWEVLVERRSRDLAGRTAALLRRPDPEPGPRPDSRPGPPAEVACRLSLPGFPHIVLIDRAGTAVQPRIPRDECGFPDAALQALTGSDAGLTEVGVTRLRQQRSQAEVASGCQGYKNMIAVEAESPSRPAVAGPVFPARPEQLHACVYQQVPGDPTSSTFSRGRPLTAAETATLVDQLGDVGPGPERCDDPSLEYAVLSGHGGFVLVEIGGCDRVLRDDDTRGQLRAPSQLLAELR